MISDEVLKRLVWHIHSLPELAGCVVGFHGNGLCKTIGYPSCVTPNSELIAVVIEEVALSKAPAVTAKRTPEIAPPQVQDIVKNRSKIGAELVGAGISCGLTLFSVGGMVAGAAGEIPTGGASTLLIVASWSSFVMGAVQCANGLVRVGAALSNPDADTLDQWDRVSGYATTILIVDAIGVTGGITTLPFAVRNAWAVVARMRAFSNVDLSFESLRKLNRVERFKILARLFQDASRTPEGAHALIAAAREARIGASTMQRSTISVNHSQTLVRIIREETVKRLHWSLAEVFANITGHTLSASPSELTGSGSGSLNYVVNLIDAGAPIQ